jgi:hypothetical protein
MRPSHRRGNWHPRCFLAVHDDAQITDRRDHDARRSIRGHSGHSVPAAPARGRRPSGARGFSAGAARPPRYLAFLDPDLVCGSHRPQCRARRRVAPFGRDPGPRQCNLQGHRASCKGSRRAPGTGPCPSRHRRHRSRPRHLCPVGSSCGVRLTTVVPLVVLLVTAILTLSVLGLRYERARLLADFAADQEETAGQLSATWGAS